MWKTYKNVDPKQCNVCEGSVLGHLHGVVFNGCFRSIGEFVNIKHTQKIYVPPLGFELV
jgi:hypothetical protein